MKYAPHIMYSYMYIHDVLLQLHHNIIIMQYLCDISVVVLTFSSYLPRVRVIVKLCKKLRSENSMYIHIGVNEVLVSPELATRWRGRPAS